MGKIKRYGEEQWGGSIEEETKSKKNDKVSCGLGKMGKMFINSSATEIARKTDGMAWLAGIVSTAVVVVAG